MQAQTTYRPLALAIFSPASTLQRYLVMAALVIGGSIFVAVSAQVRIHLSFTPVPITGQTFAVVLVGVAGVAVHRPLSTVPENTMKFAVGLMLTTFGTFWAGEGIGISWAWSDATLPLGQAANAEPTCASSEWYRPKISPALAACQENVAPGLLEIPDHVLVRQTLEDCLHEAMDIDGLTELVAGIESGRVTVVVRDTTEPSVLAHEILNGRPFTFLDDAPLEERRSRAIPRPRSCRSSPCPRPPPSSFPSRSPPSSAWSSSGSGAIRTPPSCPTCRPPKSITSTVTSRVAGCARPSSG